MKKFCLYLTDADAAQKKRERRFFFANRLLSRIPFQRSPPEFINGCICIAVIFSTARISDVRDQVYIVPGAAAGQTFFRDRQIQLGE